MDPALVVTLVAASAALLVAVSVLLWVLSGRRRLEAELEESRARLEALARQVETARAATPRPPAATDREYLITTVGEQADAAAPAAEIAPMSAGQFASVALGESLVRVLSFGYGVRRALSAENRNRIGFEIRREVRRARKQRRRDLKDARRTLRADQAEDAA